MNNSNEFIEDLIATTVGVEPLAMFYVLKKMEAQLKKGDTVEKDPMLAAYVDEVLAGIDHSIMNQVNFNGLETGHSYRNDLDRWIDAQPDLKYAQEHMPQPAAPNRLDDNFVWFECPMNLWLDSQPEIKQALEQLGEGETVKRVPTSPSKTIANDMPDDHFVWFEPSMNLWLDSQPDLRHAFAEMEEEIRKSRSTVDPERVENTMNLWMDAQPDLKQVSESQPAADHFQVDENFVWFENPLNLWLEAQPDLKHAFERWGEKPEALQFGTREWTDTAQGENKEKVA